jgi:hypothetical protein
VAQCALRSMPSILSQPLTATSSIYRCPLQFHSVLSKVAPDLIINPAAYTAVDRAEDEVEIAYRQGRIAAWPAPGASPSFTFLTTMCSMDPETAGASKIPQALSRFTARAN